MATKDYASPAQARLMRAVAHGWKPKNARGKLPSRAVANEFVDVKDRGKPKKKMYEGGLAPMSRVEEGKGGLGGLGATVQAFRQGGEVNAFYGGPMKRLLRQAEEQRARQAEPGYEPWMAYGTEPLAYADMGKSNIKNMFQVLRMQELGWQPSFAPSRGKEAGYTDKELKDLIFFPPEATTLGGDTPADTPTTTFRGPRGRFGGRGGRRRNGGGGRPPGPIDPGGVPIPGDEVPPRIIPPAVPPVDYTPPDRRAGRDTAMSQALIEHRRRVAASLGVPPGIARGGAVRGYQEGGKAQARPGHAEDLTEVGRNPYPVDSYRYKAWERQHHVNPAPPPPASEVEEPPPGFLDRLFGRTKDLSEKSGRELEEMEEAMGGYIQNYQVGGLARAMQGRMPWRGAPPPRVQPGKPPMGRMPPGPVQPPRMSPPLKMPPGRRIAPPPGKTPFGPMGPTDGAQIEGGPRVPPNLRGFLQREQMMNRPRRGIPGPAGAGGMPNRVGQSDQQGGLARALQRGTGRPPMSRRQGFYR